MVYDHKTPLHYAADNSSTESGQLLLKLGAEIEVKDENNLHLFNILFSKTAQNLLNYYSNVMQKLKQSVINNETRLHYSADNSSTESAQLLLERDTEIEVWDNNNKTPLHCPADNNSTESA